MEEGGELTKIERDLVLKYLVDDNVPLTVTLEDKPQKSETDLVDKKTVIPPKEERVPTSAVFPVAIPSEQTDVLKEGVILLKNPARTVLPFLGKRVRVQFYFNRLGLYFVTEMKEWSGGLAIVIPTSIKRIPENITKRDYSFFATLSYEAGDAVVSLECLPLTGWDLFSQPKWADISDDCQIEAKALLEKFVLQVKTDSGPRVSNGLHLLSVARFLSGNGLVFSSSTPDPIEGRLKPFAVIFADESRVVLASGEGCQSLTAHSLYKLSLVFSLSESKLLKRTVHTECSLERVFENDRLPSVKCISLRFERLKEEDWRFLREKFTGQVFDIS